MPGGDNYIKRVAFIGNYLPRQCGIATFTTDLCESFAAQYPETACLAVPVNDTEAGYPYPARVRFEIAEQDLSSYRRAADFLNINNVDLVCLQHEYGIFGGPAGSHILALLADVRMPVVTTLHTVLKDPDPNQRRTMEELVRLSDRLVVMSRCSMEFLKDIYGASEEKIDLIPHGIPDVPFVDPNFYKDQFGIEGKFALLTFGLLSANKGIEHVINALPEIAARHPEVVYIVLGATHPHVKRREGESYRLFLERTAEERGVKKNVIFHNRFVSITELVEFIGAADIYLTPYLNPEQIVSGTLAYAAGAGKAVVSTPYWYAQELLAEGRGVFVPFADPHAIADAVLRLVENPAARHAMRKRAYLQGREMTWPKVAERYMRAFERARELRRLRPRPAFSAKTLEDRPGELPPLNLSHLRCLTDSTGILQHAIYRVPNFDEGYTTDDNARALLLTVLLEENGEGPTDLGLLAARYLAFLWHAYNFKRGRFRNLLGFDHRWLDEVGSEDCHGRALWALGSVVSRSGDEGLRGAAGRLFSYALPATQRFTSPRAWAFCLIGIQAYLERFSGDRAAQDAARLLTDRLLESFRAHRSEGWAWFEDCLAYDNAVVPHALIVAGRASGREEALDAGLRSLEWLTILQNCAQEHFVPIGSHFVYRKGGERPRFDQQPIEAQSTVAACLEAYSLTAEARWRKAAQQAFEWFLGKNDLGLPLYDPATGGCRDGLHPDRVNQNQGAESTLAFLLAWAEMRLAQNIVGSRFKR